MSGPFIIICGPLTVFSVAIFNLYVLVVKVAVGVGLVAQWATDTLFCSQLL